MTDDVLPATAAAVRHRLGVRIAGVTKGATGTYLAQAEMTSASATWHGWATGEEPETAADLATIECAERWAQFEGADLLVVRGTIRELAHPVVNPVDFGLYSEAQYVRFGSRFARFDPDQPRSWVTVVCLDDGSQRLVPLELVRPGAKMVEPPLAAETSSGTAAHTDRHSAVTAAACEVVERDAAMLWWHRRTSAPLVTDWPDSAATALTCLRANGFVVVAARLDQDIAVPTCLAIAFRGRQVALGLSTHADRALALGHALGELIASLTWPYARRTSVHLPVQMVRTAADHLALYDDGSLHAALRSALDETLAPEADEPPPGPGVFRALAQAGLNTLVCDLTPPKLAECGLTVVRVLVPGLIPHYIGGDGLRLGLSRLVGRESPGTFRTLLPHPFG